MNFIDLQHLFFVILHTNGYILITFVQKYAKNDDISNIRATRCREPRVAACLGVRGTHGEKHLPHWESGNREDDFPQKSVPIQLKAARRRRADRCGSHQCRRRDHPFLLPVAAHTICARADHQAAL